MRCKNIYKKKKNQFSPTESWHEELLKAQCPDPTWWKIFLLIGTLQNVIFLTTPTLMNTMQPHRHTQDAIIFNSPFKKTLHLPIQINTLDVIDANMI